MKTSLSTILALVLAAFVTTAQATTPEQEKAFVASYKKAFESNDKEALTKFLHTEGATAEVVEMFTMMMTMEAGKKLTSIELIEPSKEEAAKYNEPQEMPDGKMYKMGLKPIKQLVVVIEEKSDSGSSKSTSKSPVAEKDGKLVIPLPVPAK